VGTATHRRELQPRDGFLLVSLIWGLLPAFGHPFGRAERLVVLRLDHAWHDRVHPDLRCQFAGQSAGQDLQGSLGGSVRPCAVGTAGLDGQRQVVDDAAVPTGSQVRDRPCWPGISVQEEQSHVFYTLNLNSMTSPSATT